MTVWAPRGTATSAPGSEPAAELARDVVVEGPGEGAGADEREDGGVAHARAAHRCFELRRGRRRLRPSQAGGGAQCVGLVRALPREVVVVAAEVAVGGRLAVDGTAQVEVAEDGRRTQVEVLADEPLDGRELDLLGALQSTITETGWATPMA